MHQSDYVPYKYNPLNLYYMYLQTNFSTQISGNPVATPKSSDKRDDFEEESWNRKRKWQ